MIIKALEEENSLKFVMEMLRDMRMESVSLELEILSIVLDSFIRAHHHQAVWKLN